MFLGIKTDSEVSEYYLVKKDGTVVDDRKWGSGRNLADGILKKLEELIGKNRADWDSIDGIILFKGPGSFTGLRIGVTVGNSIAYAKKVPIVGELGDAWLKEGVARLNRGESDNQVIPEYGSEPNITKPVK